MYSKYPVYSKGSIVNVLDRIDPLYKTVCTIRAIEQDDQDKTLYFYYLVANNDELNKNFDPRIGYFFDYLEYCNPRIEFVSAPVLD